MGRLDLHLHSTHSDGSQPPAEIIAMAHKADVRALAITDHDILTGLPDAVEAARPLGIDVIPGVEISSRFDDDELHILGYYFDPADPTLLARLKTLRESRHRRNPLIVERLRDLGVSLTYDEVRELAGTDAVGRPHIARLLMEKGHVKTAKEAFDRYLARGKAAYVARELPEPTEAIRWIRDAGGVAVLAHPLWVKRTGEALRKLCEKLKEAGLGGIEVHYSTHTPQQTSDFLNLARHLDLLVTGGSDYHGLTKPDIEVGTGRGNLTVPDKLLEPLKNAAAI